PAARSGSAARGSAGSRARSRAAAQRPIEAHARQEVVHGEVLVGAPAAGPPPNRGVGERPAAVVVARERLPHRQVARGTHVAAPEAAGEEPLGGPPADPAERRQARARLLVVAPRRRPEVAPL